MRCSIVDDHVDVGQMAFHLEVSYVARVERSVGNIDVVLVIVQLSDFECRVRKSLPKSVRNRSAHPGPLSFFHNIYNDQRDETVALIRRADVNSVYNHCGVTARRDGYKKAPTSGAW